MELRRRRLVRLGTAVAAVVLAGVIGPPPHAGAASDPSATSSAALDNAGTVVTLITGDRVRVLTAAGGRTSVQVMPARGRERVGFLRSTRFGDRGDETSVVPVDAAPLLRAGKLDPELFNVTGLVREGFTDAASPTLPLIVTYAQASAAVAAVPAGTAATTRALPSVNGLAIRQEKRRGSELWTWLTGASPAGRAASRTLVAGVTRVWLDGVAHPTLDASVPQIGAPAAWQAGYTGAGVTVGVLDTGVKADHPDLAGIVIEQRDFTDSLPDGGDNVGHGTHVAGTIAGTAAASNGRYKGVAPGAKLIDGKVCATDQCSHSDIIAGMEWAAPKARVVNMSLGGSSSDGTDLVSLAVNRLTAEHGTLFVIAAGNAGTNDLVSAPASADAAMAVGSVTKQDATSSFSSRGPRRGDYAIKPDIAAPGSDIVATRAKGTPVGDINPVDDNYNRLNGTSMATPHVAGAAAILAQQHPDWRAEQLKTGLMSAAKPTAGVFDQGAGRVDVARAVAQRITSPGGSVSYGRFAWPRTGPVAKKVTYRNDGDAAVSLTLSVTATGPDGRPAPAAMFAPSVGTVSVPARGTAEVVLTATPTAVGSAGGLFGGRLTATAAGVTVQTAFGAYLEPESYNVTVRDIGRNGTFEDAFAQLVSAGTGQVMGSDVVRFDADGVAVVRVTAGKWDVNVVDIATDPDNLEQPYSLTAMSRANVTVARDTTVTLDATKGRPVAAVVDKADARQFFGELGVVSGTESGGGGFVSFAGTTDTRLFAVPSPTPVTDHINAFFFGATLAATEPGTDPAGYVYHLAFWKRGGIPANTTFRARDRDLATVNARYHTQGALTDYALRTDAAQYPLIGDGGGRHQSYPHTVPSRRTEYYTASPDITWSHHLQVSTGTSLDVENHRSFRSYRPGRYAIGWNRAPLGPAFGAAALNWQVIRDGTRLRVAVPLLSASEPHQYNAPPDSMTGTTTLTRDGRVIGTSDEPGIGRFDLPATAGTYTLRATGIRSVPWSVVGTRADITWTFKEPGATAKAVPLPLLVVRAGGAVDEQSLAPAGQRFPLMLTAQHQPGAPAARLTQLRVEASYDDGARWVAVPTEFSDRHGCAMLNHPAGNGFVSLRITARDAAGNSVVQTVIRAYQTTAGP